MKETRRSREEGGTEGRTEGAGDEEARLMKKRRSEGGVEEAGEGDDTAVLLPGRERGSGGGGRSSGRRGHGGGRSRGGESTRVHGRGPRGDGAVDEREGIRLILVTSRF